MKKVQFIKFEFSILKAGEQIFECTVGMKRGHLGGETQIFRPISSRELEKLIETSSSKVLFRTIDDGEDISGGEADFFFLF